MEVQYKRLVAFGSGLASNTHVENRDVFAQELKDLEASWAPLKDNICDTLDLLIRWVWPPQVGMWIHAYFLYRKGVLIFNIREILVSL